MAMQQLIGIMVMTACCCNEDRGRRKTEAMVLVIAGALDQVQPTSQSIPSRTGGGDRSDRTRDRQLDTDANARMWVNKGEEDEEEREREGF